MTSFLPHLLATPAPLVALPQNPPQPHLAAAEQDVEQDAAGPGSSMGDKRNEIAFSMHSTYRYTGKGRACIGGN